MKIKYVIFTLYMFFSMLVSVYGYSPADKVVVIINDEVITKAELDAHINLLKMQMGKEVWDNFRMTEEKALRTLIEDRLILQEAKRNKIVIDERQVTSRIERIRKDFNTEEEFTNMLVQQGLSLVGLTERIREQLLSEAFISREIRSRIFVGPKEVTDFYETHIDEFRMPEEIEVENICVSDETLAEDIYAKLKLGLDFDTINECYSETEGLSGIVKKGELRKEIDEVIFSLEEGSFSPPIEIKDNGYFIFFIRKKYPPGERKKLIEVQDRICEFIAEQKFQEKLKILLNKLIEKAYIDIKNE